MIGGRFEALILCGLLAVATIGTASAQSATGGVAGTGSGTGDSGISVEMGGIRTGIEASGVGSSSSIGLGGISRGNGSVGASGGAANATAGTGSYTFQPPTGVPSGFSGAPSVDTNASGSGSLSGLGVGSTGNR